MENNHFDATVSNIVFWAFEGLVLTNNDNRDSIEKEKLNIEIIPS